jgi:hypothetical protein
MAFRRLSVIGATWQARLIQLGDERQVIARKSCSDTWEAATHVPGAYADFVAHVVPKLQRRGLYQTDHNGARGWMLACCLWKMFGMPIRFEIWIDPGVDHK